MIAVLIAALVAASAGLRVRRFMIFTLREDDGVGNSTFRGEIFRPRLSPKNYPPPGTRLRRRDSLTITSPAAGGTLDSGKRTMGAGVLAGIANVKVEPLAKALNVTTGSFYWHFAKREDLYDALLQDWYDTNTAPVYVSASVPPRPRSQLKAMELGRDNARPRSDLQTMLGDALSVAAACKR